MRVSRPHRWPEVLVFKPVVLDCSHAPDSIHSMDYESEFTRISLAFDTATEDGRRDCHRRCHEFAQENISNVLRKNEFMHYCSVRLKQPWIHQVFFPAASGNERIFVDSHDDRFYLFANQPGIQYLVKAFTMLSNSNLSGEHIHLDQDDQIQIHDDRDFEIGYFDDSWFDEKQRTTSSDKPVTEKRRFKEREIEISEVKAVLFAGEIPPFLGDKIHQWRLYKIVDASAPMDNAIKKSIRDSDDRMVGIEFMGEKGNVVRLNIDLDDPEIVLLDQQNLDSIAT